jgi:type II secretory pathway pseudopilin PulG
MKNEPSGKRRNERGHLMAGLVAATAVLVIMSTVAFQEWGQVLRRDNEAEMIFRAQDIVRAIQRYRIDHGGQGPLKLEQLLEPGTKGQYYIRQLYEDPLVRGGKWGLLYAGPGGTIIDPSAEGGQGIAGLGRVGEAIGTGQQSGSSLLNPPDSQQQEPGQEQQPPGGSSLSSGSASGPAGLPIAGVRTLSSDQPFRVYNGMTDYSQWLFTYLDLDGGQAGASGNRPAPGATPGQPGGRPGQPGNTLGPGQQRPGQSGQQRPGRPGRGRGRPGQRPNPPNNPR